MVIISIFSFIFFGDAYKTEIDVSTPLHIHYTDYSNC